MSEAISRRLFLDMGLGVAAHAPLARAAARPPNVLFVLSDDQGYGDLSCHGNTQLKTSNMDRLAAEGVEMTQFYASPVCSPTRSSLMTGRYNYRTGIQHTSRGGALMHTNEVTVAEMFRGAGYRTGIFGKWHLGDNYPMRPVDQGFDESLVFKAGGIGWPPDLPNSYFDSRLWHNGKPLRGEGYCTEVFTDATIRFIETNRSRPFFAYLPSNLPHGPLVVDKKYSEPFRAMGLDANVSKLYGMVSNLDENLGRLLKRLSELNLEENTIVMFMSDNGAWGGARRFNSGLAGWKGSVQDGGTRVPFFFRWPARVKGGRKVDRIAAHIDVLPTLLDAAGVKKPESVKFDGRSLMPLMRGDTGAWADRNLFLQFHRGLVPQKYQNCAVRNQRYKAVSRANDQFQHSPKDLPLNPEFKLYDMENDPGEKTDIAKQYPGIVDKMKAAYDGWYEEMRRTRDWAVGVIHIGSQHEPVTRLCLYQDNCFELEKPVGWSVEIERAGRYRITVERADYTEAKLQVRFRDQATTLPLEQGENVGIVRLPSGAGMLNIWVEEAKPRMSFGSFSKFGDCDIEYVDS